MEKIKKILLYIILLFIPYSNIIQRNIIHNAGWTEYWKEAIIIIICLISLYQLAKGKKSTDIKVHCRLLPSIILFYYILLWMMNDSSKNIFVNMFICVLLVLSISLTNLSETNVKAALYTSVVNACIISIWGIIQAFVLGDVFLINSGYKTIRIRHMIRLTSDYYISTDNFVQKVIGTFSTADMMGVYLAAILISVFVLRRYFNKLIYVAINLLCIVTLIFTFSKTAWIVCFTALIIYFLKDSSSEDECIITFARLKAFVKTNAVTLALVAAIVFEQVFGLLDYSNRYFIVGNANPLFFIAPVYVMMCLVYRKFIKIKPIFIFGLGLLLFSIIQNLLVTTNVQWTSYGVNIVKIMICITLMYYAMGYENKINWFKFVKYSTSIMYILFGIALLKETKYLWRLHDRFNMYENKRLQLLYTEPSEVGLHVGIIVIVAFAIILDGRKEKKRTIPYMIMCALMLLYSKSLIGILTIIAAAGIMLIIQIRKCRNTKVIKAIACGAGVFAVVMIGLYFSNCKLVLRMMDVLRGNDSSTNYRVIVSAKVCWKSIKDTFGLGVGFSQIKTPYYQHLYSAQGLEKEGIVASFFNAVAEEGIFAIVVMIFVIYRMIKSIKRNSNYVKIGLFLFIIMYQLMGTHFTNPLCWIIYGIIIGHEYTSDNNISNGDLSERTQS